MHESIKNIIWTSQTIHFTFNTKELYTDCKLNVAKRGICVVK